MEKSKKKTLFDEDNDASSTSSSSSSDGNESPSSSDEESQVKFKVNKKFAKEYQNRKQREELIQVRQRDGGIGDSDDDSSDESEDENGELLTNSVNLQFLKTIKALKNKDETIYDQKTEFFDEANPAKEGVDSGKQTHKPQKFKDVIRNQILEQIDEPGVGEKEGTAMKDRSDSKFNYDDQQEELRKAFLQGSKTNEDDEDEDDWMVVKKKTVSNDDPREEELKEEFKALEKISKKTKKSDSFKDPRGEVKNGEKFLLEYIKNKKWIDNDASDDDSDDDKNMNDSAHNDDSSIDDVDRADDFEANYNFRFEQAAAETATSGASLSIQTYARGQTMNTVRRTDTARKDKRVARKERKEAERKEKEEQLKRLKNAKRQELNKKLSEVKAVLGSVEEAAVDEAAIMKMLEGDYDPEKFEKAMQTAYGQDFYEKEDAEWRTDTDVRASLQGAQDGNDVVGQDDVDGGMYDNYDEEGHGEEGNEEWNEEDNEEYVGGDSEETKLEKKVKQKIQDELYKLDYEDIVAGMPTRFKYRQVEANDYGLTTQEILLARDTTLKQFVSLKKMAPYNETGEFNAGSKKRRRFREMLKNDLEEEMETENVTEEAEQDTNAPEADEPQKKKRRRLKKGKKKSKGEDADAKEEETTSGVKFDDSKSKNADENVKSKRRRKKGEKGEILSETRDDANLQSTAQHEVGRVSDIEEDHAQNMISEKKKSKKKKRSKKKGVVPSLSSTRLASYGL